VNLRGLLAVCVGVAAVAVAGPAVAAPSFVTASGPAGSAVVLALGAPRQVNLRWEFESALRTARSGPKAGVVPSRNSVGHAGARAGKAPAACTEPNCDMSYGGGPVQHSPHVYLWLWGPGWSSTTAASSYLASFYSGLGVAPDDSWSTVTSQYGDSSGIPGFGSSVFMGTWQDVNPPPANVTLQDLDGEAKVAAAAIGITDKTDAQLVIASQSGTCFNDSFAGNGSKCKVPASNASYCAWHTISSGGVPFTNLPYQPDARDACGQNFINSPGTYDGFSIVGGHEYAETITDPNPPTGWIDPSDEGFSGGEIGDKCAWGGQPFNVVDPAGNITLSTGSFAMQSLWSNTDGKCVMSPSTTTTTLTLASPGTQSSTLGSALSVFVMANYSGSGTLTYSATGLPPGLSIDSSTGHITGKPSTTAGTWHPTAKVTDGTLSASTSFTWQVKSATGNIRGFASKCVDDYLGHTANGTKIDLWGCGNLPRQRITFLANGELKVSGKCITNRNRLAVLEPCTGSTAQIWTRRGTGQYVVRAGNLCLATPGSANGTQLRLAGCANIPRLRWSLP
jgi:serine protease